MSQYRRVINMYRSILRFGKEWQPADESSYIMNEARTLFRLNANLTDPQEIDKKLLEAESRLELCRHYKIPYPRYYNVAPNTTMKTKLKRRARRMDAPVYMDSLYEEKQI